MLSFVLTDVAVPRAELQRMLAAAADASFNCMTIDADQSASDSLVLFSSGRVELPAPAAERDEARAPRRGGVRAQPGKEGLGSWRAWRGEGPEQTPARRTALTYFLPQVLTGCLCKKYLIRVRVVTYMSNTI